MMVDGQRDEPIDVAVVRRLREEFGRLGGLSIAGVARSVGMKQQALSERMNLHVDFRISEIAAICDAIGASYEYVATGIRAVHSDPPPSPHPGQPNPLLADVRNRRVDSSRESYRASAWRVNLSGLGDVA